MERQDHDTMLQWMHEALDGELDTPRSEALATHLKECDECRSEQERCLRLNAMLAEDRIEVAPGFVARVMASLPIEAWEVRPARSFRLAVGMIFLLASSSLLLLSASGAAESAPLSLLGSIADLLATSALAGAGLLGATWRGVGFVLHDLLTGSPVTLIAFVATLVALHGLLWRLLRTREKAHASPDSFDLPRQGD